MNLTDEQSKNLIGNYVFNDNPTGRMITPNSFGNWINVNNQFNSGKELNSTLTGALFPTESGKRMENPQDRIVFGYSRIGYDFKSR